LKIQILAQHWYITMVTYWGRVSKVLNLFCDGPIKEAHCKKKTNDSLKIQIIAQHWYITVVLNLNHGYILKSL
jgi:hypothetical protein